MCGRKKGRGRMADSAWRDSSSKSELSSRTAKTALLGLAAVTAVLWFSSRALLSTQFLPHWYCFAGNRAVLWTTVISDFVIVISYVVISVTLGWLVRRAGRDLPYSGFF